MPRAFITGITGQDGSYLTEFLLARGYEVHGTIRRERALEQSWLRHLAVDPEIFGRRLFIHPAELDDLPALQAALQTAAPDEVYHLASQTHVGASFQSPAQTCESTALGAIRLLELVRQLPRPPRFFHASSSEVFGQPAQVPQDETAPFAPINPYGCAKSFATQMVAVYRRSFGLFACNGILYNHESPRRGETFVTRKICRAAAAIKLGFASVLPLGDTSARRDWGDARDYVRGMWLSLQQGAAEDYVFATGVLHSVQDVVEIAFATVGLDWRAHVRQDAALFRPAESTRLIGDASKARRLLGWIPQTTFQQLIVGMTEAELAALGARS